MKETLPTDYRNVLKSVFDLKKASNSRFSLRKFSMIVGFKSPNYLKLILDGKRNLTTDTAELVSRRLKMDRLERAYFLSLVKIENAKNDEERSKAEQSRQQALKNIVTTEIPAAKREVLTKWYHLVVRELFFLKSSKQSPTWIAKMLGHCITADEAENSFHFLTKAGFLVKQESGYAPADPVLDTNDEAFHNAFMIQYHSELLQVWSKNLSRLDPKEQELGVLNIPISSAKIPELKAMIRKFQDEVIGFSQLDLAPDRVVQLGTYLVPFPKDESKL